MCEHGRVKSHLHKARAVITSCVRHCTNDIWYMTRQKYIYIFNLSKKRKTEVKSHVGIGFSGLVPKRESQIQKERFATGERGGR